jgi:hypothetical protein
MVRSVALLAILLAILAPRTAAQRPGPPGSVPAKAGSATLSFGDRDLAFDTVTGTFTESHGLVVIALVYKKAGETENNHLNVNLMVQGPGPVNLDAPFGNGIGLWWNGDIHSYTKGKSQCTMTLTKATAREVEGTANCDLVHQMNGAPSGALRNVKFSAIGG